MKRIGLLVFVLALAAGAFVTQSRAESDAQPQFCRGRVINAAGLNLRQDHNLNAPIVRLLAPEEEVVIHGFYIIQDARNEWAQVTAIKDGLTGWTAAWLSSKRYLTWDESLAECYGPYVFLNWAQNPPPTPPPTWTPTAGGPVLTATPTPTITPTNIPPTCEVRAIFALRVRTGPGLNFAAVTPSIRFSEVFAIDQVSFTAPYLWAHHSQGWTAIRSGTVWWVSSTDGATTRCPALPGWPANFPGPP